MVFLYILSQYPDSFCVCRNGWCYSRHSLGTGTVGLFSFSVGVANYNAIYGTLAAVPVFLVWIFTSWLIVLFGLEIVFAHQHRGHGLPGSSTFCLTATNREELAVALMVQVNLHFKKVATHRPPAAGDQLNVPLLPLETVFDELERWDIWLLPREVSPAGCQHVTRLKSGSLTLSGLCVAFRLRRLQPRFSS